MMKQYNGHWINFRCSFLFFFLQFSHSVVVVIYLKCLRHCRAYLREVVEMTHIFFKIMEKFCSGRIVVQEKRKKRSTNKKSKGKSTKKPAEKRQTPEENHVSCWRLWSSSENKWSNFLAHHAYCQCRPHHRSNNNDILKHFTHKSSKSVIIE